MQQVDVLIIGAGAAGLMCAIEAGKRGRRVLVVDHNPQPGRKLLLTGGGRCNFTNTRVGAENYISHNPHFCKSALSRYSQWDFIELLGRHAISYHERAHGQLFCNNSARDILDMLLAEGRRAGVTLQLGSAIGKVSSLGNCGFTVASSNGDIRCQSLVVASGGLSMPAIGASPLGYRIAEQFNLKLHPPRAGLVPFTLQPEDKARFRELSGIAVDSLLCTGNMTFRENLLFTHRGLSGPAVLQISSYWQPGAAVSINFLPDLDLISFLVEARQERPQRLLKSVLAELLPKRMVATLLAGEIGSRVLQELSERELRQAAARFQKFTIKPNNTEGYRTAEVTIGGVDCDELSSKTMECRKLPGLYFIGEVVDVSGWLGGYNLQWAWSSGWCAGQYA